MFVVALLQWWYGAGWKRQLVAFRDHIAGTYDYFSIDLLARSWFAPFRQISAGKVQGSLAVHWRAFVDRTISRFIGALMRTIIMLVGTVAIALSCIVGVAVVMVWLVVPFIPVALGVLAFMGVQAWTI